MNNKLIALLEKQLNDAEKEEEKANTKVNQINKKI